MPAFLSAVVFFNVFLLVDLRPSPLTHAAAAAAAAATLAGFISYSLSATMRLSAKSLMAGGLEAAVVLGACLFPVASPCLHHHGPFDFKVEDVAGHAARNSRVPSGIEKQFLAVPSNASAYSNLQCVASSRCWRFQLSQIALSSRSRATVASDTPRLSFRLRKRAMRWVAGDLGSTACAHDCCFCGRNVGRYLTSVPHVAGTDGDVHMAYWLRNQMQRYGLSDSRVEAVDVLLSCVSFFALKQYVTFLASRGG